jgi:DNA-binding response OmpR family regulator
VNGEHVLVVDDDPTVVEVLTRYLDREGFDVLGVGDGRAAVEAATGRLPDLVVLDLMLPEMGGLDVFRRIRLLGRVPVVMLTALGEEEDRVSGLEVGADDYVTKPFSPREVVARMKAILRRSEPQVDVDLLELGDVSLNRETHDVKIAGEPVELTAKEFDLLAYFLANPGAVLSRDVLLDRVWGVSYPGGTRTVDVHVAQLRRKLGRPELIRTLRGSGYKAVSV